MYVPTTGKIPCRHPTCGSCSSQSVGPFVAVGTCQGIFIIVSIATHTSECCFTRARIAYAEIRGILLLASLEHQIIRERYLTHIVLQSPRSEPSIVSVV